VKKSADFFGDFFFKTRRPEKLAISRETREFFTSFTTLVLTAPSGEIFYHSYRLEFHCTNNVAEYEVLILGLNLAIDKGVTILEVKGDSDLIVSQVLMRFATKMRS
jgi:hypothetical protein